MCSIRYITYRQLILHYFQSLYGATDLYELKSLQITKYDMAMNKNVREVLKRSSGQHECSNLSQCSTEARQFV